MLQTTTLLDNGPQHVAVASGKWFNGWLFQTHTGDLTVTNALAM